jgi:hypothetical protein
MPGNWLIVVVTAIYAYFYPEAASSGVGIYGIGILAALAILGEVLEFVAGAAIAGKQGASRRAMAMAVVGTMVGSVLGGAAGAFAGAWLGELWKGKSLDQGMRVGTGAMVGRLLGTSGKLLVGATMVVVAAVDACY